MIGFVVRLVACLILAVASVFAIGDIARSLSVEGLRLTTMAEALALLPADGLAAGGAGSILALIANWPVSPTLAALALVLLILARRRSEPRLR